MDKYLRLGKTSDVVINITLNEMYFVHRMLEQQQGVLVNFKRKKKKKTKMVSEYLPQIYDSSKTHPSITQL